jgi:hypothetical protein
VGERERERERERESTLLEQRARVRVCVCARRGVWGVLPGHPSPSHTAPPAASLRIKEQSSTPEIKEQQVGRAARGNSPPLPSALACAWRRERGRREKARRRHVGKVGRLAWFVFFRLPRARASALPPPRPTSERGRGEREARRERTARARKRKRESL